MDLPEAKEYLRVDFDEDDSLIQSIIDSSDQYLKGAGCGDTSAPELYKQAQKLLISHFYENRSPVLTGTVSKVLEFSLQSILLQLKADGLGNTAGDMI